MTRHASTPIERKLLALGAIIAVSLTFGISAASAGRADPPGNRDGNHCVNFDGVDYNALYGISDQFLVRPDCVEVTAGEHWIRPVFWSVAPSNPVYPAGYVPSLPTPLEDFLSKLTVKVVVDGGTARERTRLFTPEQAVRTDFTTFQVFPGGIAFPTDDALASMLPRMNPLSIGTHTSEIYAVLSAPHCDGLGINPDDNCLPAGETLFAGRRPFTVVPPSQLTS